MIFLGILIGLILAAAGLFLYDHITGRNFDPSILFKSEQEKALSNLKEKKNAKLKEITNAAEQAESALRQNYKQKETQLQKEFSQKEEDLKEAFQKEQDFLKKNAEDLAAARSKQAEKEIQLEKEHKEKELLDLEQDFTEKKEKVNLNFLAFSEQISLKREKLQKEIEDYEAQQSLLIARFQKDEEIRNQRDFYKIEITPAAAQDIQKLKNLALNFNNPNVIYKLIWEVYYRNKFMELIGRIGAKDKKCGIYKITNVNNEKVYIGQTKQVFSERLKTHIKRGLKAEPSTNNKLYNAMWEEGIENFTFEILCQCEEQELSQKEIYYIKFYKATEWGYNTQKGG